MLEGIDHLKKGADEFFKFILSMKEQLITPDIIIIFLSGIVGYACQAALFENKQNYSIVNTTNGKKYIYGNALNHYLLNSKGSLYNILMGKFCNKLSQSEPLKINPFLIRVDQNIGNENYLINDEFNPEQIFDFEFYHSTWKLFYDKLIKYCNSPDEWPILISISLCTFLDKIDSIFGRDSYKNFVSIAFENAIYVSKISQI